MKSGLGCSWVFVCVVGSFMAGMLVVEAGTPAWASWAQLWSALSAIGTIGAVVAAIWIALQQYEQKRSDERQLAVIVAAKNLVKIQHLELELYSACYNLSDERHGFKYLQIDKKLARIQQIKDLTFRIDTNDLPILVALPGRVGEQLARVQVEIDAAKALIESVHLGDRAAVDALMEEIWVGLVRAQKLAAAAVLQCKTAIKPQEVFVTSFTDVGPRDFKGLK